MAVFSETGIGQTLNSDDYPQGPMTSDTITDLDGEVLNLLTADGDLLRIISGKSATDDVTDGNSAGMPLGQALDYRIRQLEERERFSGSLSESDRYTLDFYRTLAKKERYRAIVMSDCVDYASHGTSDTTGYEYDSYTKMAAYHLTDGTCIASFAGTGAEISSWLEDGRMDTTENGVAAQQAAAAFVSYLMRRFPDAKIITDGYSKGGNESVYAAIMCEDQSRIIRVLNYDGPGFGNSIMENEEFVRRYNALKERLGDDLFCFSPENSVVGHLMNNHDIYHYFKSSEGSLASGFMAHDCNNWKFNADGSLVRAEERSDYSIFIEGLMEDLLGALDARETDIFYDLVEEFMHRNGVQEVWQLNRLFTGEDGSFDLAAMGDSLLDFAANLNPEQLAVLDKIVHTAITPDNVAKIITFQMAFSNDPDGDRSTDVSKNFTTYFLSKLALTAAWGKLAAVVYTVLGVAVVTAVTASILRTAWDSLKDAFAKLKDGVTRTVSLIYDQLRDACSDFSQKVNSFLMQVKDRLINTRTYQDIQTLFAPDSGKNVVLSAAILAGDAALDARSLLHEVDAEVRSRIADLVSKGANFAQASLNSLVDGCGRIISRTHVWLQNKCAQVGTRAAGSFTLRIDQDGLGRAVRTLASAQQYTNGMGSRLRRLTTRLMTDGEKDEDGVLHTFVNMFHLSVATICVDLDADVNQMYNSLRDVSSQYDTSRESLRLAVPRAVST